MTSRMETINVFKSNALLHTPKVMAYLIWVIFCNVALLSNFLNHKVRKLKHPGDISLLELELIDELVDFTDDEILYFVRWRRCGR